MKDPRSQRCRGPCRRQMQRGRQEILHLLLAVEIGPGPVRSVRTELPWGHLGERIGRAAMADETAYETQSSRALGRLHRFRLLHPLQSKLCSDMRCLALIHERDKPCEQAIGFPKLETETAAQSDVLL